MHRIRLTWSSSWLILGSKLALFTAYRAAEFLRSRGFLAISRPNHFVSGEKEEEKKALFTPRPPPFSCILINLWPTQNVCLQRAFVVKAADITAFLITSDRRELWFRVWRRLTPSWGLVYFGTGWVARRLVAAEDWRPDNPHWTAPSLLPPPGRHALPSSLQPVAGRDYLQLLQKFATSPICLSILVKVAPI